MMDFEAVIGLEVHAQLKTKSKIFCSCSTEFGKTPNTNTCPVCLGMPGVLPVLNKEVVSIAIKLALATNCQINEKSIFARKNYFYPDLPKGYQISQYEYPLAEFGHINIELDNDKKKIGITRIHLEEDAGKLIHDPTRPISYVDFNRTGTPLAEIVSEPDIRTPKEAGAYLRTLHSIVKYIDACDGNMEEGSFRCDANISIRPVGQKEFGTRTELKNLNSFKYVEKAIEYEINRQILEVKEGRKIIQETRLWDSSNNKTISMRDKENANDYRYFPDPDLLPLIVDKAWIEKEKNLMPAIPEQRKERFAKEYGLPLYDSAVLTANKKLADYFEEALKIHNSPKLLSNWIMGSLLGLLNASNLEIENSPISAKNIAELVKLIDNKTISGNIAKTVFEEMAETSKNPLDIVKEKGLIQVSDKSQIEDIIDKVLEKNQKEVENYKNGKVKLFGFFVGQVMKESRGKANPQIVNEILKEKLGQKLLIST